MMVSKRLGVMLLPAAHRALIGIRAIAIRPFRRRLSASIATDSGVAMSSSFIRDRLRRLRGTKE